MRSKRGSKRHRDDDEEEPNPTPNPNPNPNPIPTPKRRKPQPTLSNTTISPVVAVTGIPGGCGVLDLKSRFEAYGPIARIRVDGGSAFVAFRSRDSAEAALAAAVFGVVIRSQKVQVSPVNDPDPETRFSPSKLLEAQIPLSKHGKSNKKLTEGSTINQRVPDMSFKGRTIVAYDDLL